MSRLTFDDLTPDDMPAPYVDDSGDRADAFRDSLGDLVRCGVQTTGVSNMASDIHFSAMVALHDELADLELDIAETTADALAMPVDDERRASLGRIVTRWQRHHDAVAKFYDLDVYLQRVPK